LRGGIHPCSFHILFRRPSLHHPFLITYSSEYYDTYAPFLHYNPNCSLIDSRTRRSYSGRLSRYNLQQSMFAPLSRFGSRKCRIRQYSKSVVN
jgi:hypothetical protein